MPFFKALEIYLSYKLAKVWMILAVKYLETRPDIFWTFLQTVYLLFKLNLEVCMIYCGVKARFWIGNKQEIDCDCEKNYTLLNLSLTHRCRYSSKMFAWPFYLSSHQLWPLPLFAICLFITIYLSWQIFKLSLSISKSLYSL